MTTEKHIYTAQLGGRWSLVRLQNTSNRIHQIKRALPIRTHPENSTTQSDDSTTNDSTCTMNSLAGKVALVTGGSKGIGRATCYALAKAGASVVVNYSSDASSADAVVKEIGQERALAIKADAGSVEGAEQMVKSALDRFGRLDVVVANAGKWSQFLVSINADRE